MINNFNIAIIGLGYVGLPLAVELSKHFDVVGFDINQEKIKMYKKGIDPSCEIGDENISNSLCMFTYEEKELKPCNFYIITVPTPINSDKTPNLEPILSASKLVGKYIEKNDIVVYESTVYPGTTEEICVPIIEEISDLRGKEDFKFGYSPERISPGEDIHTLVNIKKIVSGCDPQALEYIDEVYSSIIKVGTFRASCIKVAEASKVIENAQRDVNIAFMNEISMVFDKLNINTTEVLKAANTKWNFLDFYPGLVGGHCIGVDPYYFIYKAEQQGFKSRIISNSREINDGMGQYIAGKIINLMIMKFNEVKGRKVGVFGITFKENCNDIRNTKIIDVINILKTYSVEVIVSDPIANVKEVKEKYGINLSAIEDMKKLDCILLAVPHKNFIKEDFLININSLLSNETGVIIDIRGVLKYTDYLSGNIQYWSL